MNPARLILQRCVELAAISDEPGKITRTFASPAMRRANELVARWMHAAGMSTRVDAVGNLIGHYDGEKRNAKVLLLGSHLDTVPDAGKFDGPLGVLLAIACVEKLHRKAIRLPFAIEVVGFADEEGVRYQTTYLGSKVLAGCVEKRDLKQKDASGISMTEAIRQFGGNPDKLKSGRLDPKKLAGYIEAHIEQGPVLEAKKLAVGVVANIVGQTRASVRFHGRAGHAGTTPMELRKDALCAAAEFILAVEISARKFAGLVATVGKLSVSPGASNVIPGSAQLSLDIRHAQDSVRRNAWRGFRKQAAQIARRRKLTLDCEQTHEAGSVRCSESLSKVLTEAVSRHQKQVLQLSSGAGHDAAIMVGITPAAMLFVRCRNGVSHHPDESVKISDVQMALNVLADCLQIMAQKSRQKTG